MALITCVECQKIYSDKANACPACGCPTHLQGQAQLDSKRIIHPINSYDFKCKENDKLKSKDTSKSINKNNTPIALAAIVVGAVISLSSGLISGSERIDWNLDHGDRYGSSSGGSVRQKTGAESFASNGLLIVGILTGLGGCVFLLSKLPPEGGFSSIDMMIKEETFDSLVLLYQEHNPNAKVVPDLESSWMTKDQFFLKDAALSTLCVFKRVHSCDETIRWKVDIASMPEELIEGADDYNTCVKIFYTKLGTNLHPVYSKSLIKDKSIKLKDKDNNELAEFRKNKSGQWTMPFFLNLNLNITSRSY